jgi:hypothetical protein
MEAIFQLGQQPLFRLLAALIVLTLVEIDPMIGGVALFCWSIWVTASLMKIRGQQ